LSGWERLLQRIWIRVERSPSLGRLRFDFGGNEAGNDLGKSPHLATIANSSKFRRLILMFLLLLVVVVVVLCP
jgi:hypothetical protein